MNRNVAIVMGFWPLTRWSETFSATGKGATTNGASGNSAIRCQFADLASSSVSAWRLWSRHSSASVTSLPLKAA